MKKGSLKEISKGGTSDRGQGRRGGGGKGGLVKVPPLKNWSAVKEETEMRDHRRTVREVWNVKGNQ